MNDRLAAGVNQGRIGGSRGRRTLKIFAFVLSLAVVWAACVFYLGQFRTSAAELSSKHLLLSQNAKKRSSVSSSSQPSTATTLPSSSSSPSPPPTAQKKKKGKRKIAVEVEPTTPQQHRHQHQSVTVNTTNNHPPSSTERPYYDIPANAPLAYLLIISNEDFLDGALVLGKSLRQNSPLLRNHSADLSIIITQGRVSLRSQNRLRSVGFDKIFEVPSLALLAPGAYWKDTFDKAYMFNLTQYRKIVFMDADMINVRPMDVLFEKDFGDPTYVGAIGFRGGSEGPYFQTGMMVIQPTRAMFDRIYERFLSGVPPRGSMYNHGMNGRDGVLLRDVFGNRFKILDNKYSRNLNPRWPVPNEVISLHLRGKVKPWFDRNLPNLDPELGKKEFGHPYVLFWDIYENYIHKESDEYRRAIAGLPPVEPFGGSKAGPGVSPLTHVWMMRYSQREYVQLTTEEDRRRRLLPPTPNGLEYVAAKTVNTSCDEVCGQREKKCSQEALVSSYLQNCTNLMQLFQGDCKRCELGVYWKPHPGSDYPALDIYKGESICKYNLMFDDRGKPKCESRYEHSRRACPCAPVK